MKNNIFILLSFAMGVSWCIRAMDEIFSPDDYFLEVSKEMTKNVEKIKTWRGTKYRFVEQTENSERQKDNKIDREKMEQETQNTIQIEVVKKWKQRSFLEKLSSLFKGCY